MKKIFFNPNKLLVCLVMFILSTNLWAEQNASSAQCKVYGSGNSVTLWQTHDIKGNQIIKGATGTVTSDPSTWNVSVLQSASQVSNPLLFTNDNGDAVALWQYTDAALNYQVAAAVLPAGRTSWTTTIPLSNKPAGHFDQKASIDLSGNIFATWTATDTALNQIQVIGVTGVIGTTATWNTPFVIAPTP